MPNPSLASLAPYLRPLTERRTDPYATMSGRRGSITVAGNEAVDDSPAGMVGDNSPQAQYDRALAAEAAQSRSNDLTNWLNEQRAQRVNAQFEMEDPEGAARVRAMQMTTLRPQSTARPEYDALQGFLRGETPIAAASRQRQQDERIQGEVAGRDAANRQEADWFGSEPARNMRRQTIRERLQAERDAKLAELEAATDPRAIGLREEETAGRVRVAQAANPVDWRVTAMQGRQQGQGQPTVAGTAKIASTQEVADEAERQGVSIETMTAWLVSKGYTIQ